MPKRLIDGLSRRQFIGGSVVATAAMAMVSQARATPLEKSAANYQGRPSGDEECARCVFWEAGGASAGTCSMVSGPIAASGWCAIWTAA